MKRHQTIAAYLFTLFEHYDKLLFTLSIPFLSPLFFPDFSLLSQLILGYALIPITTLARPVGAWFFGRIGDHRGALHGLNYSAISIGIASLGIALLPTFQHIGYAAPLLLTSLRFLQNFCFAGQTTGSILLLLEKRSGAEARRCSSFFQSLSALGALGASLGITFMLGMGFSWRWLFVLGGLNAILPLAFPKPPTKPKKTVKEPLPPFRLFFAAALVCGFLYGNYKILTSMLSGLLPHITTLKSYDVMEMNTFLLGADIALIALFGQLFSKASPTRLMAGSSLALALIGPLLFPLFAGSSYWTVFALRTVLLIPSCLLTAPFYAWLKELAPPKTAYTFIGLTKAFGLQCIGAPAPAALLALYQQTDLRYLGFAYSGLALLSTIGSFMAFHLVQKRLFRVDS